mmetsp:Transcript_5672/g.16135  ORF Transcript_5672/g.16135 Transcript_5672/m.16135 type:complete len:97 (+) Transcript_5672:962-1252(+)
MDKVDIKFEDPDIEGLTKFLVEECSFSKERVDRYVDRLSKAKSRTKQRPLDSFFGAAKVEIKEAEKFDPTKRKAAPKADNKRKMSGGGGAAKRGKA